LWSIPASLAAAQTQRRHGKRVPPNQNRINDIAVLLQWTHADTGGKNPESPE